MCAVSRVYIYFITFSSFYVAFEQFHTDVWDCHWSPKLFRVTGEVAWTYPPFADGDLSEEAKEEVVGRIAIVLRGKVPISHKALSLQVTIFDVSLIISTLI